MLKVLLAPFSMMIFALLQSTAMAEPIFYGVSDGRLQKASLPTQEYYQGKERGWFWYEDPPDEEELPLPQPAPAPQKPEEPKQEPKAEDEKPMSSGWFRKNMVKFRDKAVDEPTQDNVAMYLYLQRVMLDKAERFAEASQITVMSDALLDENSRRPIANFGSQAKDEMAAKGVKEAAMKLAKMAGLWFFYSSDCSFCIKQSGVLRGLMNSLGFKVLPIALDGLPLPNGDFKDFTTDQGQAKKMGVETTPALFLVKPGNSGGVIQLGQGLLSGEDIVNRAIMLAHQQGWLTESDFENTRKVKTLEIDTTTLNRVDDKAISNPAKFVDMMRENLKSQLRDNTNVD